MLYQLSYAHHIALTKNSNIFFVEPHLTLRQGDALKLVRMKRLELLRLAALEPKSSVSTNSTTSALELLKQRRQTINLAPFQNMGWTKGIEPSTTGVTIPCSTN